MQQQFPLQQRHGLNTSTVSSIRCDLRLVSAQVAKHGAQTHGRHVQHA
jgi:hypothetical protein